MGPYFLWKHLNYGHQLLKVVCNGVIMGLSIGIPNWGPIVGDHRIYLGSRVH